MIDLTTLTSDENMCQFHTFYESGDDDATKLLALTSIVMLDNVMSLDEDETKLFIQIAGAVYNDILSGMLGDSRFTLYDYVDALINGTDPDTGKDVDFKDFEFLANHGDESEENNEKETEK